MVIELIIDLDCTLLLPVEDQRSIETRVRLNEGHAFVSRLRMSPVELSKFLGLSSAILCPIRCSVIAHFKLPWRFDR